VHRIHSTFHLYVLAFLWTWLAPTSASAQAGLVSDEPSYVPGQVAVLTGSGFGPGEPVSLVVVHEDGSPSVGPDHDPWTVNADASGAFVTTWTVCSDDCVGLLLLADATGSVSGSEAGTTFFNHDCGDGIVTSVVGVGGSCTSFTPAVGNGPDDYEVVQGGTYIMTIEGVSECAGDTITVFVQGGITGNFCFNATGGSGTYVGTFVMPNPACFTYPISYKCGANAPCNHPDSFAAQGPTSGCNGVHLRAANFDSNCVKTSTDEDCGGCVPCVLTCPPDVDLECGDSTDPSHTGTPTGCTSGTYMDSLSPGSCAGNYVITRHWSAADGCGGTATCDQIITVSDTTAPVISGVGPDGMVECPGMPSFSSPTASDSCDPEPALTFSDETSPGDCPQSYSVTRTWTATDACGNSSMASQTITVTDTTAPVISGVGSNGTVECPGMPSFSTPSASDACDPAPSLTFNDETTPGPCPQAYSVTRTWTATDACGNSSMASQTITVTDTTAPVITCPPDVSVTGCCVAAGIGTATATDCGDVIITSNAPATFCLGDTVVTWTATDGCGNSSSCDQVVTVLDITLDFETDGAGAGLLHGQSLETPGPETPYTCPSITSGPDPITPGNGNNGAAIFNSTTGPFGADPDLNVNLGNILYLQRNGSPTDSFTGINGPDTWDHPNDDEDGGTLTFDFCSGVQALSIDLIDIDFLSPQQDATVTLTDSSALTRTYYVPGGWTADGPGPLAVGTLSLNAVGNQPGLNAVATESTQAGFDETDILQIKVRFGSSGALDNLRYCPSAPKASVTMRNGSGVNPPILTPASLPVIGAQWAANLDCSHFADGMATMTVRFQSRSDVMTPSGEVLIGGELLFNSFHPYSRSSSRLTWDIPFSMSLAGLEVHAQGLCQESGASSPPSKLRQHRAQLSNALDLILGF